MTQHDHLRMTIEKYTPLEEAVWKDWSERWLDCSFSKGQLVTRFHQVEGYFYFIHRCVLRGYTLKDGSEISYGFTYDGEFSGVYDSFLDQTPAQWQLDALVDTVGLKISFQDMMTMFDAHKSVERWGRLFNAKMLLGMGRRQLEVRNFSAEERFDRLVTQSPHILQLVPQKHLASYLGMTPETFSRLRRLRMQDDKRS